MPKPRVSILLPCYNAESTLGEAVASIRAQTFDDWELILFDDGSTDGSLAIARDHAAVDNRIRVVASEHVGLVSALQRAGGRAGGDLIARMDADDVAHRERLAKQVGLMDSCPDIDVSGTLIETTGARIGPGRRRYGNWLNGLITHEEIAREFFVECPIAHPTLMVGRAAFEEVGGYRDASWAEDYDLCMRLFLSGKRFAKVPEMLLQWRESPGRLSMSDPRYSPAQFRACKRHYLMKTYLSGDRRFHQWGAGQVGKAWLREWDAVRPAGVVDINPRKIGRVIHGTPVISPEELGEPGATFIVVAVGAPGARDEIRAWLRSRGYEETRDFVFVA